MTEGLDAFLLRTSTEIAICLLGEGNFCWIMSGFGPGVAFAICGKGAVSERLHDWGNISDILWYSSSNKGKSAC